MSRAVEVAAAVAAMEMIVIYSEDCPLSDSIK